MYNASLLFVGQLKIECTIRSLIRVSESSFPLASDRPNDADETIQIQRKNEELANHCTKGHSFDTSAIFDFNG
jgi:hypothetical protein